MKNIMIVLVSKLGLINLSIHFNEMVSKTFSIIRQASL